MTFLFANNARTTLASSLTATATSISLESGGGDQFPSPGTGEMFALFLTSASSSSQVEVCYCTARSSDTLTVTRGMDGTTAQTFSAGDYVTLGPVAGVTSLFAQAGYLGSFSSTIASSISGYAFNAILADASTAGKFWVSTASSNTTVPGNTGASWVSLFDGMATEEWVEAQDYVEQQIDGNTIGVDRAGYSSTAKSLAFRSTDGTWRYPVASDPVSGQDRVLQLGFDASTNLLQVLGLSGVTRSFLPGNQVSITNGTSTTLGDQKWQSFYIESISGSSTQVTFPLGFSALPTVLLQPTSEFDTNLAIQANPVPGTLTTGGLKVNINNAPGVASTNGCGLWVWAFGAL